MNDDPKNKKDEESSNITSMDQIRVKRLKLRGHQMSMLEEFDLLRVKFYHNKLEDKKEAIRFVTLLKYFMENGPTESFRLNCQYLYDKYCKKYGL